MAKKTTKNEKPAAKKTASAGTEKARKAALAEISARIEAPAVGDVPTTAAPATDAPATAPGDAAPQTPTSAATGGKKAKGEKKAKAPKTPKEPKVKKMSALDAAAQVLAKAKKPLNAVELIEAMATQGLWSSPNGKTPSATLYAAVIREIAAKGSESRFRKADRGTFEFAGKKGA